MAGEHDRQWPPVAGGRDAAKCPRDLHALPVGAPGRHGNRLVLRDLLRISEDHAGQPPLRRRSGDWPAIGGADGARFHGIGLLGQASQQEPGIERLREAFAGHRMPAAPPG